MSGYGQFCPLAKAAEVLCQRWTILVMRELIAGSQRFNELQRGLPQMSPSLLTSRLRQLESLDVVERKQQNGNTVYCLKQAGHELREVIEAMSAWGHRWVRSQLLEGDLDAGLLMWDMRRTVDSDQFPEHRIVVQFEFPDADEGQRDWWLVSCNGDTDLCLENPGHEIDVLVRSSLATMTAVWICERSFSDAVRSRDITVLGTATLCGKLQRWLQASALSRLGEQKQDGIIPDLLPH